MDSAELRVQLEGAYERIEAEVLRWEEASRSLAPMLWDERQEWRYLVDGTPALTSDLRQLSKRVAAGAVDNAQLLSRLKNAQESFHALLDLRLRGLGEVVDVDTREHKVRRLIENLPVRYVAKHWRGNLSQRLVALAFVAVPLTAILNSPIPAIAAVALLFASFKLFRPSLTVIVTRRSLIVDRTQWYLSDLKLVRFSDNWSAKETSFLIQTKAGTIKTWSLLLSNIDDLARAFSGLGVPVTKD